MPSADELRQIPEVLEVEELGGPNYRLRFADAFEAREKIVEMSTSRGWRLNEIYLEKSSLDAIFAELSKK